MKVTTCYIVVMETQPAPDNRLRRQLARLAPLPASRQLTTLALRRTVPFLGSAGVSFVAAGPRFATLALRDRRRVHNHIRGVHSCAAALLAEATSGFALALCLPDDRLYLVSRMEVDYVARMRGGLVATARITEEDATRLMQEERGEVTIDVEIVDEAEASPLTARLTWAWRPKKRKAS